MIEMMALVEAIYNNLMDMDFRDYDESKEADMENLLNDLELLEQHGNGALLNAIKMMVEE
jgi:hypothetical protein